MSHVHQHFYLFIITQGHWQHSDGGHSEYILDLMHSDTV